MRMKKTWGLERGRPRHFAKLRLVGTAAAVIVLLLGAASRGEAQSFGSTFDSVAAPSSYRAPTINAAALSYGTGRGIGYAKGFDEGGMSEDFDFFVNLTNFAYQYQGYLDDTFHTFALSFPLADNFYLGGSASTYDWDAGDSTYSLALLSRPADFLSLGFRTDFPGNRDTEYRIGLGLRPLAFTKASQHRLTFTLDFPIIDEKLKAPVIAARAEPLDGLEIGLGFDMENEGVLLEASLSLYNLKSGTAAETDSTRSLSRGRAYVHVSPAPFNRPKMPNEDLIYDYSQDGPLVESQNAARFGNFYMLSDETTLYKAAERIRGLAEDPLVSGIIFINEHPASTYAHVFELKEALDDFKAKGKKVIFFSEMMSSQDYLLAASSADRIYLAPSGMIDLRGVSVFSIYLASFFDKWGIEVQTFRSSIYKSGYDFLSESSMREAEREALMGMTEDLYESITGLIEEGRGKALQGTVEEIVDAGPYLKASRALERGLVDELIYRDQLEETIPFYENTKIRRSLPDRTVRKDWSTPSSAKIAVINAAGPIHSGTGIPGNSIGSESISRAIKKARNDSSVRAILLRIDSSGGSVIASDTIAREIKLCSGGDNAKPIVASMGPTAASGGYYIAAYADEIIAYPTTLTGSIGVVATFPNIEMLLQKQQIGSDMVKTSENADFGSLYRRLSEEEQEQMHTYIESAYTSFVSTVAEGRDMSEEEVEESARGRVWTGRQAEQRNLVDKLGGISRAVASLRELADLPGDVELVDYSYAGTAWGTFTIDTLSGDTLSLLAAPRWPASPLTAGQPPYPLAALPKELRPLAEYLRAAGPEEQKSPLYLMTYHVPGFSE